MEEIRGTLKYTKDTINEPIRKWGFPSFTLAFILIGMMVSGIIVGMLIGIWVIAFLLIYALVVVRISKYNVDSQKKGIDSPISDRILFRSMPKKIRQDVDIRRVYETKGSE